ncbi:eukaryotic polypeptide chain release factor 3 [Phellopilus nigrolimitatus]|nr:eukaryotic polypeptide chain release factor 3 [Phellopilus nigrolimitatus]
MSRLNIGANEFVPGKFRPPVRSAEPPPAPIERPEQSVAPAPPPTITLNIGGSKPTPTASAPAPEPAPVAAPAPVPVAAQPPAPKPTPSTPAKVPSASTPAATGSKTFSTDAQAVADQETLKDLFGDVKQHLSIVFIGHVDAGKSTMGGNILFLTGMVDKRTMEKYEKDAKDAGKTVEVGRGYFETDSRRYTILDAPGHKTYVPSMISGAAQADVAVLVVSARKGEFETGFERGGQTREHVMLVKTAGVAKLVIVINKMDDTTVQWDKARYDEIIGKVTPFVKSAGYNPKTDVTFVPVSAQTGQNLKDRVSKSIAPWREGPSLLELLDQMPMVDRKFNGPLMLPISEKYKDMGAVIVGKIESGRLQRNDNLLVMPNHTTVEVSAIYNELEDEVSGALCGDNVRVRLKGIDDEDITTGFVLTSSSKPVHAVRQFEAQLAILEHKNIICAGYSAVLHVHTLSEEVNLAALLHYFDKATGRKSRKPPQFAKKGQKIVALIETAAPICIERFVDHPQMGRFTLRDEGRTVAIGKVTKLIENPIDVSDGIASLALGGPAATTV